MEPGIGEATPHLYIDVITCMLVYIDVKEKSNRKGVAMANPYSLLCYTRVPTSREEANNADIALSMHLALRSPVSGKWEPLNENYGIFFAAGVPNASMGPMVAPARLGETSARSAEPSPTMR